MTHDEITIKDGDVIQYATRPGVSVRVEVRENTNGDAIGALIPVPPLCLACKENDAYGDELEGWPFCPKCLTDAMIARVVTDLIDSGEAFENLTPVFEHDDAEISDARLNGRQYIELRSAGYDMLNAMSQGELREELESFVARYIIQRFPQFQ